MKTGFGTTETGSVTSKLMHVNVNYVKQSTCNSAYSGRYSITDDMMCAADTNQDSCQGDSGGPLYDSDNNVLVGVGRALADGVDCSYLCDVAVHPEYQGIGLGRDIINKLLELSEGYKKIILYANPGKEGFYSKLGFKRINTAMAILKIKNLQKI